MLEFKGAWKKNASIELEFEIAGNIEQLYKSKNYIDHYFYARHLYVYVIMYVLSSTFSLYTWLTTYNMYSF